jgi:hypothetical protein
MKETYLYWTFLHKNFPKVERLGLGNKIEQSFLLVLELTFLLSYSPINQKIVLIDRAISKLDVVKFFTQLAWEGKIIHTKQYSELSIKLEEIGRQLGGWKKGLQTKNLSSVR